MTNFLKNFLLGKMVKSKKFWYTVVGCLTTLLSDSFGLNPEEVNNMLMSLAALVIGQGISDSGKK
tara:strand:+ start:375 stop:569 length:195 start_codon:yes stop_codon:yes gene_type:complete